MYDGKIKSFSPSFVRVEGAVKHSLEISKSRIIFLAAMISLCYFALALRIINLSLSDMDIKETRIAILNDNNLKISRRNIVDRNGSILATNLKTASLYANPRVILDVYEAVQKIRKVLPELDEKDLFKKLDSEKGFVWLKRNLHPQEQLDINNLGIPGLYFADEEKRVYPHGSLVSHILGFVGTDGHGLSGIEKEFNNDLFSESRVANGFKDEALQLSLDIRVQSVLHEELMKEYKAHKAKGAAGIIMDVNTSEVLAIVSLPDFNPNVPAEIKMEDTFNNATYGLFEMGSTFKSFTMAMALDSGLVGMEDAYDAINPIRVAKYTIRDHHGKGRMLSVPEIFMYSSNIGTARIASDIGNERQMKFLGDLGLLDNVSLEVPEIATPIYPDNWGKVSTMTVSYGHGIAVTPIHVAAAGGAIVNGGIYKAPTLIKGNVSDGRRVMSEDTSQTMRKLLRLVVEKGTGRRADAKGYLVGGKTGTAEKPGKNKYQKNSLVSSFLGSFPMNEPKYVVLAVLDEPKGNESTYGNATAGFTAAPVVKKVVSRIAPMLGVKPIKEDSPEIKELLHVDYKVKEPTLAAF